MVADFKVMHISEVLKPIVDRVKQIGGLYEAIAEEFDELCANDPKSPLLKLVTFDRGFPNPKPEFEKRYAPLIKFGNVCIYLEAHQQFLKDLKLANNHQPYSA